jgi:hypothetical protein
VAFIALDDEARTAALSSHLDAAGLSALMLRGHGPLMLGRRTPQRIDAAVKAALDPVGRFPSLSD